MAIQNRRGLKADFDPFKMLPGEFGYALDTAELYYCYSAGNVKKLMTEEDLQAVLNSSAEAYTALQTLISELETDPSLSTSILNNVAKLQTDVGDLGYTENNYILDSEPLTDSVDKLDVELANVNFKVGDTTTLQTTSKEVAGAINEVVTDFSTHLADNTSAHGINLKANKALGGVVSLSLQNGWGGGVDVRKNDLGQVTLSGTVSIGTATRGTIIVTLPTEYKPISARVVIQAYSNTTGKSDNYLTINDTNEIELQELNATGWIGFHIIYQGVV